MANFEAFHWNFSSSTNPEIGRSVLLLLLAVVEKHTGPIFFENCLSLKQQVWGCIKFTWLVKVERSWKTKKKLINDAIFFCSFMHLFAAIKQMMKFSKCFLIIMIGTSQYMIYCKQPIVWSYEPNFCIILI